MAASAVSMLFLLVAGSTEAGLWIGSLAFGLSMATVFPTCFSLVESYVPVLGKHATVIMIGAATGEMILPALIATYFGDGAEASAEASATASPRALLWIVTVACVGNVGLLLALQRQGESVSKRRPGGAA